jgi:DNA-binding response OmpR family regulator
MPEMNGLELAGRIMAIRPGVPIIIASGYMSSEAQHEARALGVRTVIHKPYELEEMVARIRAIVDNPA